MDVQSTALALNSAPLPHASPSGVAARIRRLFLELRWRRELQASGFSIISQNCLGGLIYHDLGLPFTSPTIDLAIYGEDFVRLVEDLAGYLELDAAPAGWHQDSRKRYPLIAIGDLTVHAVHYRSPEQAAETWNRRARRVNLDDIRVIAATWDLGGDPSLLDRLRACGYPLAIFSGEPSDRPDTISLAGDGWSVDDRGIVHPILTDWAAGGKRYFEHVFDFVGWLNRG